MIRIPAIDIINAQVVRLSEGDYNRKSVYADNPLEVAQQGFTHLHLVDLDGAKAGKIVNLNILQSICRDTGLIVDFGGGIRTDEDLHKAFDAGAQAITAGSIAVKEPAMVLNWLDTFGAERIILGMDVRDNRVAVSGWQEKSSLDWPKFLADYHRAGIRRVICTDVARDGMLGGPALDLYRQILEQCPDIALTASGGIRSQQDVDECAAIGCSAAIIGKALYEGLWS